MLQTQKFLLLIVILNPNDFSTETIKKEKIAVLFWIKWF